MAKEEFRVFWTRTGETFAGKKFGEDVTDYFAEDIEKNGDVKKGSRLEEFFKLGKVTQEQPETYEAAESGELVALRKSVAAQKEEIEELKNELASAPKTVKEANKKIKDLEKQLEELTKPKR